MSRIIYNKLVRDRIPEIIQNSGKICENVEVESAEFEYLLKAKLVEEALEVQNAPIEQIITELADIQEVLDTLKAFYGINHEEVLVEQVKRKTERGGFEKRIKLLWAE